ncbi:MAG TPA: hypothetical protein VKD72_33330 [Gemmataceae bacterium]|nr:hypothetical protein [Gemmataceae bacterium]
MGQHVQDNRNLNALIAERDRLLSALAAAEAERDQAHAWRDAADKRKAMWFNKYEEQRDRAEAAAAERDTWKRRAEDAVKRAGLFRDGQVAAEAQAERYRAALEHYADYFDSDGTIARATLADAPGDRAEGT